jgi:hypothetical protein
MEKSKLESLPDKQLIQYLKYLLKIISNDYTLTTLNSFYQLFDDHELYSKAKAPIGGSLSRLDIEYIYWILEHNDINETDTIERPTLTTKEVTLVEEFVVPQTIQRSKDIPTYTSDEIGTPYLNQLMINDEIDVFNWEIVLDQYGDPDHIENYFIVK